MTTTPVPSPGSLPVAACASLVDLLVARSEQRGEELLFRYLVTGDAGGPAELWSYAELDRRARAIAARLQEAGAKGERALLLYPPGLDFVAGFFGCLYAGAVAVPTYPPDPARLQRTLPRLRAIAQDSGARFVLTMDAILGMAEAIAPQAPELAALQWVATDALPAALGAQWRRPAASGETAAFLQYTSGSTGEPKGVIVRHGNLLHNSMLIRSGFEHDERSSGVGWLPLFHDMGLIGNVLQPLYVGFPCTLMSPLAFLQQPMRWLRAISHFSATTSGGPNFAYDLCARKASAAEIAALDLRIWDLAFSGAEPVRSETLARFAEVFAPAGFRREAFYPCYGLAEATLLVTGASKSAPPCIRAVDAGALGEGRAEAAEPGGAAARALVSSGRPGAGLVVEIVEPGSRRRCAAGQVGEIWVAGPSVAGGYWNRPEETERAFGARLSNEGEDGGGGEQSFLRTGDLGFVYEGELFVTGRLKDLLIIGGRNHYPQDIERTVEQAHRSVRPGCCAAFSVEVGGEERLGVAVEADLGNGADSEAVIRAIRQEILEEHGVYAHAVALLAPRSIPKTSSGKLQRRACREGFLSRSLEEVARSVAETETEASASGEPPVGARTELESLLAGILGEQLGVPEVGIHDDVFQLGLQSLTATRAVSRIREALGVEVPLGALFEAPTAAALALRIEGQIGAGGGGRALPLVAAAREGEPPLSFAQQRLWFLDRLAPDSAFYNIPAAVRLSGPLDAGALERSLQEVVRRHEALRTTFVAVDGQPRQVIAQEIGLGLPVIEVEEAEVLPRAEEEARRPFDLARGPLIRATLLRLSDREHVLLVTMHHIASDGWSMGVLVREVAALYEAFSAGRPSPLPALPIRYADYAIWQRGWLRGEVLEAQLAYWKKQLGGAPPALLLPTDRPRPPVQTYRGASLPVALSPELSAGLGALSRREGVTLFMTLLAAFQVLLRRYTGQEDIVVGSPIAGRTQAETEGLIGFFVNTLVLRTDLSGEPTARELLGRVREVTLGAYAHQDLPFEKLVEALSPARDLGRAPLFQVMLALHEAPLPALSLGELKLGVIEVEQATAKFDVTLSLEETAEGLRGALEYSTDLFDRATIERMLGHYRTLLEGIVAEPGRRVSELPLLTDSERHQLLVEWNETAAEYPRDRCIHELFEEQAARTPESVAVVFEGQELRYRELNARANQLAHHLRGLGVGPDVLVGLCVERSAEMVVGLFGILKAGGAYVPLDPTYPAERLAFMLEDSGAPVLLTQERLVERLPEHRARVLTLDTGWESIAREPMENPARGAEPDDLAYVIHTSGSTGKPKGVAIPHRAVVSFLEAMRARPGLDASDRLLSVTSLSFDIAGLELYLPLSVGARVEVASREVASEGPRLAERLARSGITALQATPATFRLLIAAGWQGDRALRVLVGGEAVPRELANLLVERAASVWNMYGPTETTIWSCVHRIERGEGPVPIGRPIAGTLVRVLDAHGQPVPVGIPGELYIGGAGVARGYLNRPELTAERFIRDPFSDAPGARLYRTGDLCRRRADGNLEFLGRIDHQVKIRGFRIELGEIESVLGQHPAIREAVVLAREDEPGERRLVAYGVAREAPLPPASELRSYLQGKLPEYMVPAAFVEMAALPLTPNGKVDRKALPAPDPGRTEHEGASVAPRTPVEEVLAGIWAEVLRLDRVGVLDDFFELGGHSLLATQVLGRARAALGVEVPLRALFEAPTVEGLARHLEAALRGGALAAAPPLAAAPRDGELPLSFAQQRLWFLDRLEPDSAFYNIPAAVRLSGALDVGALERSLQEVVSRHEALRTTFLMMDGQPRQAIAHSIDLGWSVVDVEEAEVLPRAEEEARRPFDLAGGPLLRTTLLRLSEREHVLLVTMHHIVSDGWSMGVLVREVAALYEAFAAGRPSPLPALPIQYADYAIWQRGWLQVEVLEAQLAYWKKQLGGAPPALELPTDRPRPPVQSYRGAALPVALSPELTAGLGALSRREGVTLFMTLLAAFQVLLSRYTGQEDVVVGSPIAGRMRAETEGLIGFFVNTLVLRTDLSGEPTVRDLLGRVREVTLGAYAHQDLPFEKLVEELSPARDLGRSPLFQVMLVLQNAPLPALALGDAKLDVVELPQTTAKFDLTLSLEETAEGLRGALEYSTDLFDKATVERMLGHYRTLLEGMAAEPGRRVSELPLLTDAERHQLLVEWNETAAEYPRDRCIHELFEEQVARTPEAVAVVFEGQELSYRELNARANQLAHYLRGLGVGPEVLVGLCVERAAEMVVGLLGILKAGGAYVPLDPTYPRERLAFMLDDTSAPVLLTQERLLSVLAEHRERVLALDTGWELIARERTDNPVSGAAPDNLAYVIYTSGSTGKPKGVLVEHRGLVNLSMWHQRNYHMGPIDRTAQLAALGFDAATWEIWPSLITGAGLFIPNEGTRRSPLSLVEWLVANDITITFLPTPLAEAVLVEPWPPAAELRVLLTGGDRLRKRPRGGLPFQLVNHYGPTECTVVTTSGAVEPDHRGEPPLGRPIANLRVYICDACLQPVPLGVSGELYIGGVGVARGYLNRPELTAERFVEDPFSDEPGARMYRTGDLCRWRPDGNLEFLGRIDHQVKIRGFRIELGEIESVLGQHPAIREAAVVAREDAPGEKRLVAYLVPREVPLTAGRELRSYLQGKLPEHMVPSVFVELPALPLTPNGKIDRKALPAPEGEMLGEDRAFVAPRTPVEEVLAGIWAEVLRLDRVSVLDNFFELGGHSLLATQVLGRLRPAFGVDVPLRTLFEAPTVAGLAAYLDAALRAGELSAAPPLMPVPREGELLPLSSAQQRLWFLDLLEPDSAFYNIPVAVRLSGPLDVSAFGRSFSELVRRHETLRTTFPAVGGKAHQNIAPELDPAMPVVRVEEADVLRLAAEEARKPFDLARGPLVRATLLRLSDQEHVLLVTMHHIVSDGWSMDVLVREIAALYEAFSAGHPSPLPELPVQYADYAIWQRRWLSGEVLEAQLAYWKKQLGGAPPALELPTDRPRPPVQTYRGAALPVALSPELTAGLAALSRREGVTLFMTLLAAFQVLLSRYTGQEDIVVGSPIAGRTQAETEGLIGFFVNTLVLRTDLSGEPTVRELLGRVREATLGAYAHQDVPFEKLVEELSPARDLSRSPLFQVMLSLENTPMPELSLGELTIGMVEVAQTTSKFDLSLSFVETAGGLRGELEYSTDLFDAATIERMAGHYRTLLEGIVADPLRRVSELPLLTPAERHRILVAWNDTAAEFPHDRCVHELFEAQAERTPEAVAVVSEGQELTYGELNARANQLAHHLRGLGVGPEVLVGLCVERSVEMVVGLLGILKAGGAYVPIDPAYPRERIAFVLEDADVPVLLTQARLLGRLPEHSARVVCLDADRGVIGVHPAERPACGVTPECLAYVIYTSGSTGRPKGVMIRHAGVVNHAQALGRSFELCARDRVLQFASIGFDFAVAEIFPTLSSGATLVLRTDELRSTGALLRWVDAARLTVLVLPTAFWHLWVDELSSLDGAWPESLRLVAVGGEEARAAAYAAWRRVAPDRIRWLNGYGPTETTVDATIFDPAWGSSLPPGPGVPIGRPLPNVRLYILDARREPVPVGVPGELYIGGAGVARGYLRRPGLTAERFTEDPFGDEPGARLYRTGDLCRWRSDGHVEFLGRIDHQVKIRGFRIELGEIESVLGQHPAIREAVVLAREDVPGDKRLVAYLVPREAPLPAVRELRSYLQSKLPEYMVPSAFVELPALPLTPNGKVDRKALPAPEGEMLGEERAFVAPRTPVEEVLAGIWAEVLRRDWVGVFDNFFELGGHSLLATQVLGRVRPAFGVELPLRALFEAPTVAGLAQQIEGLLCSGAPPPAGAPSPGLEIDTAGRHEPFPLTEVQQAYWAGRGSAFELGNTATHGYAEIDLLDLDLPRFQRALNQVIERHEMLRAVVLPDGRQRILKEVAGYEIAVLDLRGRAGAEVAAELAAVRDRMSHQVLPADRWPLFEVRASALDGGTTRLHISSDGLMMDGHSETLLMRELLRLYEDPGAWAALSPLDLSFRDYVLTEQALHASESYRRSLDYWRGRVATLPPAPELPLAKLPSAIERPVFVRRQERLGGEAWSRLGARAAAVGLTPSGLLLAAFSEALSAWSKSPRFTVCLTLFNRLPLHPQVDDIVGDFTSLSLLEVDASASRTFEGRARRIQEQLFRDLDHRQVSGVRVLRELARAQDAQAKALAPVVFTSTLALPGSSERARTWMDHIVYAISQTSQVSLDHQVWEDQGDLCFAWDSVEELFPPGLLDDLFSAYVGLLRRLPDEAWDERMRCTPPAAALALRAQVNATGAPLGEQTLHGLFAAQVAQRPDQPAVVSATMTLTYEELARRARRLGRRLRERGARPNTLVAVVMDKGWEQVVAVLAVLASGAAYLPIDAELPAERIRHLLAHGEVKLALTRPLLQERLSWPEDIERLVVTRVDSEAEDDPAPLESIQGPSDLAYVIYTSGSTGLPKGVMIDHRGAVNTLLDINDRFGVGPGDRVLALSSLSFDLSVYDVFGILAAGGTMVLPEASGLRDPEHWAELLRRERVTVWNSVPALMRMLVEHLAGRAESLSRSLRLVLLSGDWIPVSLPGELRALLPDVSVISLGGATEASIWSIDYPIETVDPSWTSIPYGRPLRNQTFHVLDEALDPRPVWVPGQLYIGGVGLSLGYWRDEEKTRDRFLVHPRTGERLYKTGDLGRYLPDGNIEFLGREDHQVKIRGYRIELGEIESVLGQHPAIAEVVVLARGDAPGDKRLVAYLVAREAPLPLVVELRSYLQSKLPDYMIPAAFVELAALPLTPNGKLDRKALPAPDLARPEHDGAFVAARTPVEEALAGIWAEVLGVTGVSILENFFALGGDSILAIKVIHKAQQVGLGLTVAQMFQHQTIAALAQVAAATTAPGPEQGPVTGPVALTPIQRWFFEQDYAEPHHFNQALLLEVRERPDRVALTRAVEHLVHHHDALRLRFTREGATVHQVHAGAEETVTVSTVDLTALPAPEQAHAIEAAAAAAQASLCLTTGPLLRVAWMDLGPARPSRLLLVIHHLVVDGVSWRILLEDLEAAYGQARRGEPLRLPRKTASFQEWAERLTAHAQSEALLLELDHWRSLPEAVALPVDIAGGSNTVASEGTVEVALDVEETRALLQEVPEVYRTQINDVLLTALGLALAAWTGTRRVRVDLEGHGREEIAAGLDVSRTVGWFTALFPVVLELPEAPLGEVLKAVKEQLRGVPNRGVGYGLLRYLRRDATTGAVLGAARPADVSFNYLGQLDAGASASSMFGLAAESSGLAQSPRAARTYLLNVGGHVSEGRLRMTWIYSENLHRRATIEEVALRFKAELRALLAHCRSPEAGGRTPSDFALARLTQAAVDRLVGRGRDVEDVYPLSPMQQGMLFHALRDEGSGVYVAQMAFRVTEGLRVPEFAGAWRRVLERHAILRSAFVWEGLEEPLQIVRAGVRLPWAERDLRGMSEGEQQASLSAFLAEDRVLAFDLAQAPLMRLTLVRLGEDAYQVVWTHHHLLLDGWSVTLLLKEVFAFYGAACQGKAARMPAVRPYRDYIAWLRRQEQGCAEAFWRDALRGFRAPTPLPVCASAAGASSRMALAERRLPVTTTEALEQLSRAHGLTLSTVLQGAWGLLLSRYSGEEDVVFGATQSGRSIGLPSVEGMVGLFINTLPVRARWTPRDTVVPWLQRLQEQQAAQLPYAHTPLVEVQGVSELPRGQALFESLLVVENFSVDVRLRQGDFALAITDASAVEDAHYPLTLGVETGPEMMLRLGYAADLFDEATIERMLGHYRTLLEGIAADPLRRVSELPLLTPAERRRILVAWNDTAADVPHDRCVHELFEAQAARTPEAVAVAFEDQQLTYRELNARANQLAHHLRALGVGPEVLVGLCVERSPEMVVGLLGILKAGGAYVPLDPTYPRERLAFMLEDTGASLLLTQERLLAALPEHRSRALALDTGWAPIARERADNPVSAARPDDLAYVIYTSGSTGKPKGAMIPHRGLVNYLSWCGRAYDVAGGEGAPVHSSLGFDLTITGLFSPLLAGRKVVLVPEQGGVEGLAEALERHDDLSLVKITPAHLELLGRLLPAGRAAGRARALVIGGEALSWEMLSFFRTHAPSTRLINEYGPTETVVGCCVHEAPAGASASGPVPIGRPIANTRLYVLDRAMQPVPVGIAGELYIGGTGVARGYLKRPALTAERFVVDPFGGEPGARLYRTGDLCRRRPDGDLEYVGRIDHQVKIRGYRVELGEIESALGQHPAIREAAVLAREDAPGDRRLVAYVVAREAPLPGAGELRAYLQRALPDYMVPAAFVEMHALPLTPNGKVDRRTLPAPDAERSGQQRAFVAPRTPVEEVLAAIWGELLGIDHVGVHDDFFELGGHSLLAVRLMAAIESRLGQRLPLSDLFSARTIAQLAAELSMSASGKDASPLVALRGSGSRPPFFCVHPVGGNVLCYESLAGALGAEQPFYGLQARDPRPGEAAQETVEAMAERYLEAIRRVQPVGPYRLGGWSFGGLVAFEMARRLRASGQEVAALVLIGTGVPSPSPQPVVEEPEDIVVGRAVLVANELGLPLIEEELRSLGAAGAMARVAEIAEATGALPRGRAAAILERHLATLRAMWLAAERYAPEPHAGSLTLLRARDDAPAPEEVHDWGPLCEGAVAVHTVPGTHHTMLRPPNVEELARVLRGVLDAADGAAR